MGMFTGYKKTASMRSKSGLVYGFLLPFSCVQLSALNAKTTDVDKRFGLAGAINSPNDFPKTGSCFGATTTGFELSSGFLIPQYTRFIFINFGGSGDGAFLGIDYDGKIYVSFRNNNTWRAGRTL